MSYALVSENNLIGGLSAHEFRLINVSLDLFQIIPLRVGLLHPGKGVLYTFLNCL